MEEGQSPNTPLMPTSEDLSQHHVIDSLPSFQELFFLYIRKRKLVFPVSFFPAHVYKALQEENCKTPQVINVIAFDS